MILGLDARAAAEVPAGRGRYVRELLAALAERDDDHRYMLYARQRWDAPLDERFRWSLAAAPDPAWHLVAAERASRRCDAFLSTNSYLTAWFTRVPTAVVVYDLVAWLSWTAPQRRAAAIERATIRPAVRRAAALLCISQATHDDLVGRFPAAAWTAQVVPLAADLRFAQLVGAPQVRAVRERHALPAGFVLTAGTLEPRKNLPRLIAAHARLPDPLRAAHPLAVVGPAGWEMEQTLRAAQARPGDVRLLGHVSEDDLAVLYAGCTAFAYPSLYEGFGLPLAEAMAAGAACLTSDVSSLPELGGDVVLYADPHDVAAIAAGLARLLDDPALRAALGAAARARAATLSWNATAARTVAALEAIS